MKIDAKMDPKIDIWALRGQICEILGGLLRSLIFDEFSIGKKSAKNLKFAVRGRILGESLVEMGRVGG